MFVHKEIIGNELYLYMNGKLIYKRWLKTGDSKVFDVMAYDKYTLVSYRDDNSNKSTYDINWFKQEIEPQLFNYEVSYRYFEQGDFGSLTQVGFEGKDKGGQIDYWGLGWLGIFLYDLNKEEELINVLLSPEEIEQSDEWFGKLVEHLTDL
ncbi:hypothetical protein EOD41_00125 [Mucilaginibacter limnophilus]|uniref:Uncharacterized protein n=2 Tax=Mucilaginibacter limnophilus TaxID=1932778 RepID=A0A3S3TJA6_9SPHI|nr:hypothetical protein EOD41_00125 [Mucilaginibacter limnophilus]